MKSSKKVLVGESYEDFLRTVYPPKAQKELNIFEYLLNLFKNLTKKTWKL